MQSRTKRGVPFCYFTWGGIACLVCFQLMAPSLVHAANPAQIASSTYAGVVKPVGLGVATFGILAGVTTGFMRGFGTGVMTGLGGILLGAIIANAAEIAALVPNIN